MLRMFSELDQQILPHPTFGLPALSTDINFKENHVDSIFFSQAFLWMVIPREFLYLTWIKIWRKLALLLHLTDSTSESHSSATWDICPPSLPVTKGNVTTLVHLNFLLSLVVRILLMYKDTQAFMTLTAPTTFVFHSRFSLVVFLFHYTTCLFSQWLILQTAHKISSHTVYMACQKLSFVSLLEQAACLLMAFNFKGLHEVLWQLKYKCMFNIIFSSLVKHCSYVLIELSTGVKPAACLQWGNNRLN